jgi:hypothetical protein
MKKMEKNKKPKDPKSERMGGESMFSGIFSS